MLRFSPRETVLLTVPPLLLAGVLATGRMSASSTPAASGPDRLLRASTDDASARETIERHVQATSSTPVLLRRTLKVSDAVGSPVSARVRVAFSQDGFQTFEMLDVAPDAQGRLPLDLDRSAWVVVSVQSPGRVSRWQPPVTWGELQDADLEYALADALRVDGTSRWIDGRPMSGVRLAFRPAWTPGEYAGQVASRLKIVDEEVTTDASGRFSCTSLRPGAYRVTFPDHPKWPALTATAEELSKGTLALRAGWTAPATK
jgi:hypothetical protein